jgi:hypothetical protein
MTIAINRVRVLIILSEQYGATLSPPDGRSVNDNRTRDCRSFMSRSTALRSGTPAVEGATPAGQLVTDLVARSAPRVVTVGLGDWRGVHYVRSTRSGNDTCCGKKSDNEPSHIAPPSSCRPKRSYWSVVRSRPACVLYSESFGRFRPHLSVVSRGRRSLCRKIPREAL